METFHVPIHPHVFMWCVIYSRKIKDPFCHPSPAVMASQFKNKQKRVTTIGLNFLTA